jgi:hypothetical protein
MALTIDISDTKIQSEDTPHLIEALQKTLRQYEAREKLLRSVSPWIKLLEEQRHLQKLATPYQTMQAQILRAQTIQEQAIQALDAVERERARLLTPIDPDWEYQAGRALLQRELPYDPTQGLIGYLSQWDAIQRQLFGP